MTQEHHLTLAEQDLGRKAVADDEAMRAACSQALELIYRNVETDQDDLGLAMITLEYLWRAAQKATLQHLAKGK